MIIVEGPDGSGKTSLIRRLEARLQLTVEPRVVNQDTTTELDLVKWVENDLQLNRPLWDEPKSKPRLYDRYRMISEPIYGPILRPEPQPGFSDPIWMEVNMKKFYGLRPIIIYCLPPLQTVLDNLKNDPDNIAVVDQAAQIYSAYAARAAIDITHPSARTLVWDYTESDDEYFEYIASYIVGMSQYRYAFPEGVQP